MPRSIIELNYCKKCGCNLTKLDSTDTVCEDCKDVPFTSKEHKCNEDDDGSCCIKDDETEFLKESDELEEDFCEDDFYPYYPEN